MSSVPMEAWRYVAVIFITQIAIFSRAHASSIPAGPDALYKPMGMTGVLLGGGTAHVYDSSAVDSNPAGIGLALNSYFVNGEMTWIRQNLQTEELGLLDAATAEIAAAVKARRTTQATGERMRRYSVGLADRLLNTPILLGIAGDLEQREKPRTSEEKKDNWRMRGGLIFQPLANLSLGARTGGYFDKSSQKLEHAVGFSWNLQNVFVINGDVLFADTKVSKYTAGATVFARDYLDVLLSYGYEINPLKHQGAAGIALKSQKFRLHYSLIKPDLKAQSMEHAIGAVINFAGP